MTAPATQQSLRAPRGLLTPPRLREMAPERSDGPARDPEPLADAIAAFLRSREVTGATRATLRVYAFNLDRFCRTAGPESLGALTVEVVEQHLAQLLGRMKPISVHQAFRVLRTFCRWCVRTGRLAADPMAGMAMRAPKTLPRVPDGEDVRRLLAACPHTPEGRRNRVLIALATDSALRKEELRRLRISEVDFNTRMIRVNAGKGQKDGVTFFGEAAASLLRAWLAVHPDPRPAAFVFCRRSGEPLGSYAIRRILYRLSRRAGLARKIGPHALRHYAATAVWRRTGDLELIRRLLRHETLTMALRYVAVTQADVAAKFQHASPLDHLWAVRGAGVASPAATGGRVPRQTRRARGRARVGQEYVRSAPRVPQEYPGEREGRPSAPAGRKNGQPA